MLGGQLGEPDGKPSSETHGLGSAFHLTPSIAPQRLDRRAWQGVVCGEKPAQDLVLTESVVAQQGDSAAEALDHRRVGQECLRHTQFAVTAQSEEMAITNQLMHPGYRVTEPRCDVG